jgi:hypothetical protein
VRPLLPRTSWWRHRIEAPPGNGKGLRRVAWSGGVCVLLLGPAASEGDGVHESRVSELVDQQAAPPLGGCPVDEQCVFDPAVDGLRIGTQDVSLAKSSDPSGIGRSTSVRFKLEDVSFVMDDSLRTFAWNPVP